MEQPVTVKYRWTIEQFMCAQRVHTRAHLHLYLLAIAVLLITAVINGVNDQSWVGGLIYFLIVGGVLFGFWFFYSRILARITFAKRPDNNLDLNWEITSTTLALRTSKSTSEYTWELIYKVVRARGGFLLYTGSRTFSWLPRDGFMGDAEFERLDEIARGSGRKYRRLS